MTRSAAGFRVLYVTDGGSILNLLTTLDANLESPRRPTRSGQVSPMRRAWRRLMSNGLLGQGGAALADQVVVSGTTLATSIIVGRACSKEQFGLFMLAFSIVLFSNGVMISLISTPYVVRRPLLSQAALLRYNGNTLVYLAALCGVASLGLMLAAGAGAWGFGPAGSSSVAAILSGVIVVQLFKEYARQMCFARMRAQQALAVDSTVGAIQVAGLLWLAATERLTPSSAFGVIGLACGLASFGWWSANRDAFRVRARRAVLELDQHWQLARFAFASGLLHALTVNLYPWIVAWVGGTAAAGVWAACFAVAALIAPLMTGVHRYLAPRLADAYARGGGRLLRRLAAWASGAFWALALPYTGFLALFGGVVVVFFYGDKYADHGHLVAVLGAALLVGAAGFSFGRALFSIHRAHADLLANACALSILLTAGTWMAWQWGPLGAAYGMLATNTTATLIKAAAFLWLVPDTTAEAVR